MQSRIEDFVLWNLLFNEQYLKKVLPFLKQEYFSDFTDRKIFQFILSFVNTYNKAPTISVLSTHFNESSISKQELDSVQEYLLSLDPNDVVPDEQWLLDKTEEWCKDRSLYNAIHQSILILDGSDKKNKLDKGSIPDLLTKALAVGFSAEVGHDYTIDGSKRFDFYHRKEEKIPFDLKYFNLITNGGLPNKTLNIILAGTAVGKTLAMCHFATSYLKTNKNVLYITLEMSEERIAERIDANLLDVKIGELPMLTETAYNKRIEKAQLNNPLGRLIIKEYPTASANVNHFRTLLNELKLKKSFYPDVVIIDYINIATSSRLKQGSNVNSYTYVKAIAEELRGLAVELDVPIISATQTNRQGYSASDPGLEDTSESFGLPATADLVFALVTSDELAKLGQLAVKQLKNRYNDVTKNKRFLIGVDNSKMRLYDLELASQQNLSDAGVDTQQTIKKPGLSGNRRYSSKDFEDINI
jgi:replicative DNA helicase